MYSVRFPCIKEDHRTQSYFFLFTFLSLPTGSCFAYSNAMNKYFKFYMPDINLCTLWIAAEGFLAGRGVLRDVSCARSLRRLLYQADWWVVLEAEQKFLNWRNPEMHRDFTVLSTVRGNHQVQAVGWKVKCVCSSKWERLIQGLFHCLTMIHRVLNCNSGLVIVFPWKVLSTAVLG